MNIKNVLIRQSADDEGNAQCVKQLYGTQFLHCETYGWLHYNGKFWTRENAEAYLDRAVVDTLIHRRLAAVEADRESIVKATKPSAYNVKACKALFQSLVVASVSEFDRSPDKLNCPNGVLDLRTGQLATHHHSQRFTYCLPVGFYPHADSTLWESFLLEALGGQHQLMRYIQLAVGYSLTGWTYEEIMFYVYGPTRAGKGTFTETLLELLGKPLAVEVDFTSFTADRSHDTQNFDLAPLKPSRFIVASESKEYQRLNATKLKQLTGGNEIRCALKYKDHFEYRPQFKIWLASNFRPNADPYDDAVWARLRVIKFPNSYAGREDKTLKQRIKSEENLAGVLAWAVKGATDWYKLDEHGLYTPRTVQAATQKARDDIDFVGQWLGECMQLTGNADDFESYKKLYKSYESWCQDNGTTPKTLRGLTSTLKRKGYQVGSQKPIGGKNTKGVGGVRIG